MHAFFNNISYQSPTLVSGVIMLSNSCRNSFGLFSRSWLDVVMKFSMSSMADRVSSADWQCSGGRLDNSSTPLLHHLFAWKTRPLSVSAVYIWLSLIEGFFHRNCDHHGHSREKIQNQKHFLKINSYLLLNCIDIQEKNLLLSCNFTKIIKEKYLPIFTCIS